MNRYLFNDGGINDSMGLTFFGASQDGQSFHTIQNVPPIEHTTKDGVDIVEVLLGFVQDKELAAVGVGTLVGHCKYSSSIVNIEGVKLVFKRTAPDRFASFACAYTHTVGLQDVSCMLLAAAFQSANAKHSYPQNLTYLPDPHLVS